MNKITLEVRIMNKLAIITAFLGTVKNRYMTYREERPLDEKLSIAAQVQGCDGVASTTTV